MPKYSHEELALAIDAIWELVMDRVTDEEIERLCNKHPCLDEITSFGPYGPCGIGLGRYGGHAVGDSDF